MYLFVSFEPFSVKKPRNSSRSHPTASLTAVVNSEAFYLRDVKSLCLNVSEKLKSRAFLHHFEAAGLEVETIVEEVEGLWALTGG